MDYNQQRLHRLENKLRVTQRFINEAILLLCARVPDGLSAERLRLRLTRIERVLRAQLSAEEHIERYTDGPDTAEVFHGVLAKLGQELDELTAWLAEEVG